MDFPASAAGQLALAEFESRGNVSWSRRKAWLTLCYDRNL
jgi:hypothetical protein